MGDLFMSVGGGERKSAVEGSPSLILDTNSSYGLT